MGLNSYMAVLFGRFSRLLQWNLQACFSSLCPLCFLYLERTFSSSPRSNPCVSYLFRQCQKPCERYSPDWTLVRFLMP